MTGILTDCTLGLGNPPKIVIPHNRPILSWRCAWIPWKLLEKRDRNRTRFILQLLKPWEWPLYAPTSDSPPHFWVVSTMLNPRKNTSSTGNGEQNMNKWRKNNDPQVQTCAMKAPLHPALYPNKTWSFFPQAVIVAQNSNSPWSW